MQTQKKHSDVLSKRKPKSSLVTGQLFGKISLMALGMTSPSEEINKVPIPCLELFKAPSKYIFHVEDPSSLIYPVHLSPPNFLFQQGYTKHYLL